MDFNCTEKDNEVSRAHKKSNAMVWFIVCILGLFLISSLLYTGKGAFIQHIRNTTFHQVQATVLSTDIFGKEASGCISQGRYRSGNCERSSHG